MPGAIEDTPQGLLHSLRLLSDDDLVARLKGLAARERRATALLVAHLAELDTREVYLRAGYSSLFTYCRDVLALSDGEAYNRIEVARTARRFPVVLDLLCSGEVSLTTVRLLGPHLTADNHLPLLESARGKRKAEVEEIVARLSPRPDVAACVRKVPFADSASVERAGEPPSQEVYGSPTAAPGPAAGLLGESAGEGGAAAGRVRGAVAICVAGARHPAEVKPLSPDRYRYQLTIGGSTLEKLRLAKDMLRHALPAGDDEAILDRALTALLDELARRKFGGEDKTTSSGRGGRGSAGAAADSRHVPTTVKRAVWVRDLGRCAFVGTDGRRCGERAFVEFHHVRPYAVGGVATVENIELRCRRHNGYEERVYFARDPVDDRPRRSEAGSPTGVSGQAVGSRACSGTSSCERGRGGPSSTAGRPGAPVGPVAVG